ncbi:MAG: aldo/keto reductase [Salinirussus sp.]
MATHAATWEYRETHGNTFGRTYFRPFGELAISSIGIGTYLGEPSDAADDNYVSAISHALEHGCNVVDTAINYRHQRSERAVGRSIDTATIDRDAVLVATKGGFVPFDGERPDDPGEYVRQRYVEPGLLEPADLVRGQHCIAPDFLADQLDRSLANLDLDAIDLYYVHNPETQLETQTPGEVYKRLEDAFTMLEERVLNGDISRYGIATWDALRVPMEHEAHLSLKEVEAAANRAAERAGHDDNHFAALQLPFNVQMADAFTVSGQPDPDGDGHISALEYASAQGLSVFTSASLHQGRLAAGLPDTVAEQLAGDSPAQRAINFARSAPGVTCALVGSGSPEHAAENVEAGQFDPLGAAAFDAVFQ